MQPYVIFNPAAAYGGARKLWPRIEEALRGAIGPYKLAETARAGHARELARGVAANGARLVVAVGGDGTVNEIVNGIGGLDLSSVELAVLPNGTGWDFVRSFGISRDLDEAVRTAVDGDVREIDLGRVGYRTWAGTEERAYFANVGSAGISGAIAKRANETSKALGGKVSYYWATVAVFFGWQIGELRVSVDDGNRTGKMIDVLVTNGRYVAGGMMMCPEAEPDDGLFDVLLIGDVTRRDLAFVLPKTYRGKHLPHPRLEVLRGRVVTVDADEPLPIEIDGEQPGTTPAQFEVLPRALRLRVPRTG
jgi:YegS/Rv2252/BmrU family lipid kinase